MNDNKSKFIRHLVLSALFLFLAIDNYSAHETVHDWVLAVIFTIAFPMEVSNAVNSYRFWKLKQNSSEDVDGGSE